MFHLLTIFAMYYLSIFQYDIYNDNIKLNAKLFYYYFFWNVMVEYRNGKKNNYDL